MSSRLRRVAGNTLTQRFRLNPRYGRRLKWAVDLDVAECSEKCLLSKTWMDERWWMKPQGTHQIMRGQWVRRSVQCPHRRITWNVGHGDLVSCFQIANMLRDGLSRLTPNCPRDPYRVP